MAKPKHHPSCPRCRKQFLHLRNVRRHIINSHTELDPSSLKKEDYFQPLDYKHKFRVKRLLHAERIRRICEETGKITYQGGIFDRLDNKHSEGSVYFITEFIGIALRWRVDKYLKEAIGRSKCSKRKEKLMNFQELNRRLLRVQTEDSLCFLCRQPLASKPYYINIRSDKDFRACCSNQCLHSECFELAQLETLDPALTDGLRCSEKCNICSMAKQFI